MNMLIRGVPAKYKVRIEKLARLQNLSVNQLMVQFVIRCAQEDAKQENAKARQKEAVQRLRQMREVMYKKHGMSSDSVQMIREMRKGRHH